MSKKEASPVRHLVIPPFLNVEQFLSSALSQTGPASLPYTDCAKPLILEHFDSLTDSFPSLHPRIKTEVDSKEGVLNNFIQAYGTLPIISEGVTYHIPIAIFLKDSYPRRSPSVGLDPTSHMMIKNPHPFVDSFGRVSIPYMRNWKYPTSNLLDLCQSLSDLFGRDPPLYSKWPQPDTPLWPPHFLNRCQVLCPFPSAPPYRISEDAFKDLMTTAKCKFREDVRQDILKMGKGNEADKARVFGVQRTLRQYVDDIWKVIMKMEGPKKGAKEELEYQLQMCESAESAAEYVVEVLDNAIGHGDIPLDQYLSTIRTVSRDQFYHRDHALKIRERLNQAHGS